jgi:ssDNA-binding Zn-finger/Zn-ribbon topoisomerase 1
MKNDDKIVLCPVCLEQGDQIPMTRGRATTFYWYYRCPACGNLGLIEKEKDRQ